MKSVLVIDDNTDLLNTYLDLFRAELNDVIFNGFDEFDKANSFLRENEIDLVISDQEIDDKKGFEFFNYINDKNQNIPFIMVSGTVTNKQIDFVLKRYPKFYFYHKGENVDNLVCLLRKNLDRCDGCSLPGCPHYNFLD